MIIVRRVLVSIAVAALVAMLARVSVAHEPPAGGHHASHESHKTPHDAHHEEHHDANHERHHEDHKKTDKEAHHDWRHDAHHDEHYTHHDNHPWWRSWHHPTERDVNHWFGDWGWTTPVYYNYGADGNVVYSNDSVTVPGTRNSTSRQNTTTVQTLADVAPSNDSLSNESDWLPLGTFALTRQGGDDKSPQVLQLSVNKSGAVSGVLFNAANGTTTPVHGSVDKTTQRVAFGLGDNSSLVAETGIHNLTRDKTDLLVHQGDKKPQHYSLVRFQPPQSGNRSQGRID